MTFLKTDIFKTSVNIRLGNLVILLICLFITDAFGVESEKDSRLWNGQYTGITFGGSYGKADHDFQVISKGTLEYFSGQDIAQLTPFADADFKETSFNCNLKWGYNNQKDNIVLGIEVNLSPVFFLGYEKKIALIILSMILFLLTTFQCRTNSSILPLEVSATNWDMHLKNHFFSSQQVPPLQG